MVDDSKTQTLEQVMRVDAITVLTDGITAELKAMESPAELSEDMVLKLAELSKLIVVKLKDDARLLSWGLLFK